MIAAAPLKPGALKYKGIMMKIATVATAVMVMTAAFYPAVTQAQCVWTGLGGSCAAAPVPPPRAAFGAPLVAPAPEPSVGSSTPYAPAPQYAAPSQPSAYPPAAPWRAGE